MFFENPSRDDSVLAHAHPGHRRDDRIFWIVGRLPGEAFAHDKPVNEPAAVTHLLRWSAWTRLPANLRSGLRRWRNLRRTMMHWQLLDDRMLKDIGVSRHRDRFRRETRTSSTLRSSPCERWNVNRQRP